MAGINKMILVGHVGADPKLTTTSSGKKMASFSIATSNQWRDKTTGEKREHTDWHNVVVFNEHLADVVAQYVKKGTKLYVEGAHKTRKYTGNDGVERWASECVCQGYGCQIVLLDRMNNSGTRPPEVSDPADYGASFDSEWGA